MALRLRKTKAELDIAFRGKYGFWKSSKMKAALNTLAALEKAHADRQSIQNIQQAERDVIGAWYVWSSTSEFRKLNLQTNRLPVLMAVEMGAMPGNAREENITAFVLSGTNRITPQQRQVPDVTKTDLTVPAWIREATRRGQSGAVVLIDAFGVDETAARVRHGFDRRYGGQNTNVMENIEAVLDTARECALKMVDVTMNRNETWKNLRDRFPARSVNIVKPVQGLFDETNGSQTYLRDTKNEFIGIDYAVVAGWDANQCVASAIFGVERSNGTFAPGLVDIGVDVVTCRNLLAANEHGKLESKFGWPYLGV